MFSLLLQVLADFYSLVSARVWDPVEDLAQPILGVRGSRPFVTLIRWTDSQARSIS